MTGGTLSKKEAQSLRGRLAFAYSQVFGRAGQLALQQISLHACTVPFRSTMSVVLCESLQFLRERISSGIPRRVSAAVHQTMYILTDASFDDNQSGGLGGVLLNADGQVVEWFSIMLDASMVGRLLLGDSQVVIGELEALAPLIALDLWLQHCKSRHVVFYIDNDGARYSLIRGYSCSVSLSVISHMMAVRLEELVCLQWFARVASASNLADFPSRGRHHPMLPESSMCCHSATMDIYTRCVDHFLVDRAKRMGLGQVANKTNGSQTNGSLLKAKGVKRKMFHGRPQDSNLAKRVQRTKKVRVFSLCFTCCIDVIHVNSVA